MIDYSKLTTEQLVDRLNHLDIILDMELVIEGFEDYQGIFAHYEVYFNAIYKELFKREDYQLDEA